MASLTSNDRPYYTDDFSFLSGDAVPQDAVRLLSAPDMYAVCDYFLQMTRNHAEDRWLASKDCRNEIARRIQWTVEAKWLPHAEWKGSIQRALNSAHQLIESTRKHELAHWDSWESLETDIHISVRATRQTVEFFCRGDGRFLPMQTNLFVVPGHFGSFLASILAGDVSPAWIAKVDSEKTPGCRDGQYPIYKHRKV